MSAPKYLKNHRMYSDSDYQYLRDKGYSNKEIRAIWDCDAARDCQPLEHKPIPDIISYVYPPTQHQELTR